MPTKHLLIKGRVQGVFYRATAHDVAEKLTVRGWVKNTREGHVEAVLSGTEEAVNAFIQWCRQGPPNAVVTSVEVKDLPEETFDEFTIIKD